MPKPDFPLEGIACPEIKTFSGEALQKMFQLVSVLFVYRNALNLDVQERRLYREALHHMIRCIRIWEAIGRPVKVEAERRSIPYSI